MPAHTLRFLATLCILFFLGDACSRPESPGYTAPDNEFSYNPPDGWSLRDFPGFKYKIAFGQPSEGFAPNIGIADEMFSGPLDDYVAGNLRTMTELFEKVGGKNYQFIRQTEFLTDLKQRAIKVITESQIDEKDLRQTYYFFEGVNGKKYVITCSQLAKDGDSYQELFDKSITTFKIPA